MLTSNFAKFPEVRIYESRKSMGEAAANRLSIAIESVLKRKSVVNIIFAAAPSQNEFLKALFYENIPWQQVNAFHMDEYINLDDDAPQRFGNFLKERIFNKFNFKSVHYLNGNVADIEGECSRYSRLLESFPIDIVCMGIGENGHLAFNDPPVADFNDRKKVKVVELELACRQQQVNDGCFASLDLVPTQALTLTIPVLINAAVINCVVPGKTKAQAVLNTFTMPVDTACPSTILRNHEGAVVFLDTESAKYIL
ncbi:glucosamine-6-phosphate deaminase [Pedobacter ginsenosidimutans]|uniref:Glucosamine-6-phosphate deaminase n=1 Tax=Pedobacter ginsenosidimutans TaxID=687842 RepID=A0A0T5VMB6_9SPHI|nr:glucosamine-6-phosphate deaminase [Pedobacter ginsenosidimutans]KRT15026.1 glucosamine-6-phosphate deaminase [Pedobacter ginsenosidimutans]